MVFALAQYITIIFYINCVRPNVYFHACAATVALEKWIVRWMNNSFLLATRWGRILL